MHLLNWDLLTSPVKDGGLGLYKTYDRNQAFLGKLVWRMHKEKESPWAYICHLRSKIKSNKSVISICISRGTQVLNLGTKHVIHYGLQTSFWHDVWLPQGTLQSLIHGPLQLHEENLVVADVFNEGGDWDWSKISFCLSSGITQDMCSTPRSPFSLADDKLSWGLTLNGDFSLSFAYLLVSKGNRKPGPNLKWIWNLDCHPRIKFFIWLLRHSSLPTNLLLSSRGILVSPLCALCGQHPESVQHLFRECSVSSIVWNHCSLSLTNPSSDDFHTWVRTHASSQVTSHSYIPTGTLFIYALWSIWMTRNLKVFQNAPVFPSAAARSATNKAAEFSFLGSNRPPISPPICPVLIEWLPPDDGWLKLNVDGACDTTTHCIPAGGLIRDHHGNWTGGFHQFLGRGNSLLAECWGALLGLKLAVSFGVNCLWLESNCSNLVNLLNHEFMTMLMPLIILPLW